MDMSMVTPVRPLAAWLAVGAAVMLVGMLVLRPAWPVSDAIPDPDSARRVGHLLMEKYMVAFEGAGFLILIGIFGAVLLARPSAYPGRRLAYLPGSRSDAKPEPIRKRPPRATRDPGSGGGAPGTSTEAHPPARGTYSDDGTADRLPRRRPALLFAIGLLHRGRPALGVMILMGVEVLLNAIGLKRRRILAVHRAGATTPRRSLPS